MTLSVHVRLRACMLALLLSLLAAFAPAPGYGQSPVEWIGGTDSDWNKSSNWLSGAQPMVDAFGPINNVLAGVNNPALSTTIDLGGTKTVELFTLGPLGGGGNGLTSGRFAALEFGNVGGETEYTIQNGTINLDTAGNSGGILEAADNLTINLNASVSGGSFYQLNGNSTLNIAAGVSGGSRFSFFNGGEAGTTAIAKVNAENYAFVGTFGIWTIGAGNPSSVANPTNPRNSIVYVNANQTASQRTDVLVGWTQPGYSSKLVIRNGATVTNTVLHVGVSGTTEVSEDPEIASSFVQVGDETTTGFLNLTSTSNALRLGTTVNASHTSGTEGVLDIVNGEVFISMSNPVLLGYGRDFNANYVLPGSTGRIVFRENGALRTRANFTERDVATDSFGPGRGILEFDGGKLIVDDGIQDAQASALITEGVEVNIMDGGMVLQISPPKAAVTNAGDFNGNNIVDAADYTVWRDNLNGDEVVLPVGSGDGSGTVDAGDYDVWKAAFGNQVGPGVLGSAIIEAPLLGIGVGGLTVQGGGALILAGANTYAGDTVVDASTLSISSAYLADAADVRLLGNASLDLAFAGTDTIDQLLFDGAPQAAGSWGAIGSGATHEDARFTGSGRLMVTTSGSGAAALGGTSAAVPEPSTLIFAVLGFAICFGFRRVSRDRLGMNS